MALATLIATDETTVSREGITVTIADSGTTAEETRTLNGLLTRLIVEVPALTGTTTVTVNVLDEDDNVYYTEAAVAEGATTVFNLRTSGGSNISEVQPLCGMVTFEVIATNSQTGAKEIVLTPYVEKR